jgi:hypothetical protein
MTREEWRAWALDLQKTHSPSEVAQTIADMGEQVDTLHAVRLVAFGDEPPSYERGIGVDGLRR